MSKSLDKAIRLCDAQEVALPELSDTWRLIDKHNLKFVTKGNKIVIDLEEAVKKGVSKDYIMRLSKMSRMYGRGDF